MTASGSRGGEFYEAADVRGAYLRHRHDGVRSPNAVMEEPAFVETLGSVHGCRVLDLGCGDGSTAGLLLAAGATSYLGVDGSAGMIETARRTAVGSGATFVHGDIEDFEVGVGEFDVVISRMAFHYVQPLAAVFEQVHRALPQGGRLVFSVVHPVITSHDNPGEGPRTSWTVDDYFDRGPRQRAWFGSSVIWQHRTIEDYVNLLTERDFSLDLLSECEPRPELLSSDPAELERRRRVPLMLMVAATRR